MISVTAVGMCIEEEMLANLRALEAGPDPEALAGVFRNHVLPFFSRHLCGSGGRRSAAAHQQGVTHHGPAGSRTGLGQVEPRPLYYWAASTCVLLAAAVASSASTAPRFLSVDERVKVLIVDGVSNHDWQLNTALLRGILEPTGLFEITVSTSPPRADSPVWNEWHPQFSAYDVVIQTYNDIGGGPAWPVAVQEDFEAYVREGGGVFIYHSANNAFPDWDAYNRIIGLGWRRAHQGDALAVTEGGNIIRIPAGEGRGTGHGPRVDAVITRLGDHPIHHGLPREWKTPDIEVYYYARGPAENVEVLSYTHDVQTDMRWPVEWTVTYGRGRVYGASYGHVWHDDAQPERMRCAGVQTLIIRALWWLARRDEALPVPEDFPTANEFSIRPEIPLPQ